MIEVCCEGIVMEFPTCDDAVVIDDKVYLSKNAYVTPETYIENFEWVYKGY